MASGQHKPVVFTRDATGLVRSISAFDTLTFTLMAAGPIVLIPFGILTLPAVYEGASIPLIVGISIPLLIIMAYNTVALVSAMPRAGGDYVFGSRVIHPIWGMIPSFMVMFSFVVGIGTLAVLTLEAFVGPAIITSYPQYLPTVLGLIYVSPLNLFLVAAVILAVMFGLAIVSTRAWFTVIRGISIFSVITMLVFIASLLTTNQSTILSNFNTQAATGFTANQMMMNATASGWTANVVSSPLNTAGAMIFVFFFLAAPISAYFGGEIKNATKSMSIGMLGGTVIAWIVTAVGLLAWVGAFGYEFLSAYGFETLINPTTAPTGQFSVNALILAVVTEPNLAFLIGLGVALASFGLVAAPMLPASRILFAWSFDRLIPEKFSSISERTHTPVLSLGLIAILTILVAGIDAYYAAVLGGFIATTIIVAIAFLPNGLTAALLPFRKKDIYSSAPALVTKKVGGFPLLTITGLIHAVSLCLLIVLVFLYPAAAGTNTGSLGTGPLAVILIGLLASILFFPLAKAARKGAGIDLDLAFREIPPE